MRTSLYGVYGEISNLPGNSSVAVSHNVWTPESNRGKGNGKLALSSRVFELKNLGYSYCICTVNDKNHAEIHLLTEEGFKLLDSFYSEQTNSVINFYGKILSYNPLEDGPH